MLPPYPHPRKRPRSNNGVVKSEAEAQIAVGIGIAVSIAVGGLFPGLLKLPLTIAVLGSMESVITAVRLKINEVRHERALQALGEQFVSPPAAEAASGYLPSTG